MPASDRKRSKFGNRSESKFKGNKPEESSLEESSLEKSKPEKDEAETPELETRKPETPTIESAIEAKGVKS